MKSYRFHPCRAQHDTPKAMLECIHDGAAVIEGDGPFATISWCRAATTAITLWQTEAEADDARASLDQFRCGPTCYRHHEVAFMPERSPTKTTQTIHGTSRDAVV